MSQCTNPHTPARAIDLIVALAFALVTENAAAACLARQAEVSWSYPPDGAMDVPINARIWVLPNTPLTNDAPPELDGVPLTNRILGYSYDPGALEPERTYTLRVPFAASPLADGPDETAITFTTGTRTVDASGLGTPLVEAHRLLGYGDNEGWPNSVPCGELISALGCFDTGPLPAYGLDVTGTPIGWLVRQTQGPYDDTIPSVQLFPARCGPMFVVPQRVFARGCYRMHTIYDGGVSVASDPYCPGPSEVDAGRTVDGAADGAADGGSHAEDASIVDAATRDGHPTPIDAASLPQDGGRMDDAITRYGDGSAETGVTVDAATEALFDAGAAIDATAAQSRRVRPSGGCSVSARRAERTPPLPLLLALLILCRRLSRNTFSTPPHPPRVRRNTNM